MGIFDKLRKRSHHDDFHEAMLAAEREAKPIRAWLIHELDAIDPEDPAGQEHYNN